VEDDTLVEVEVEVEVEVALLVVGAALDCEATLD